MSKHRKYSQFISLGDSSDEEDSVIDYNVGERWSSFHEEGGEGAENNALTFIIHAAGIYALYGPAVQKKYYDLKDTYLGMSEDEFEYKTDDKITKAVKSNIKKIEQWAGRSTREDAKQQVYKVIEEDVLQTILADKMTQAVLVHSRRIDGEFEASTYSLSRKFLAPFFEGKDFTYDNIGNFFNNFSLVSPLRPFVSKTLPSTGDIIEFDLSELSEESFVVGFLSYLRLHNRSEKRELKKQTECPAMTKWKISDSMIVDVCNKNDSEKWPGTRNEQVFFKGNKWAPYEEIIAAITPEEQEQLLSHRINIKNITDFEAILSDNALSFWYLFFGCETIKNPSALIHINMIFDLINVKELSWDDLSELPMKPKGSIQKAMQLNQYYCSGMPHHYSYQTQQHYKRNTDSLIERELAITEKWLKFKLGNSVGSYLIDKSMSDIGALEAIWGLMIESFEGWGLSSVLSDDSADSLSHLETLNLGELARDV